MSKQVEFNAPIVKSGMRYLKFGKYMADFWETLKHGLMPHAKPETPPKSFNAQNLDGTDDDFHFSTAQELYKEISGRIEFLEEKGFKLMTYISAISAVPIFLLSTSPQGIYKWSIILSLIPLTLALLISLRCIGVKSQKGFFIDALFRFDENVDSPPQSKNKKEIAASLINHAVFNQNVADNTADLIKATRAMLSIGIFMTLISCCFYLANSSNNNEKKDENRTISFSDSTLIPSIKYHMKILDSEILNNHVAVPDSGVKNKHANPSIK